MGCFGGVDGETNHSDHAYSIYFEGASIMKKRRCEMMRLYLSHDVALSQRLLDW